MSTSSDPEHRIVIRAEDLDAPSVHSMPTVVGPATGAGPRLPGLGTSPASLPVDVPGVPSTNGGWLVALGANSIRAGVAAGGVGGLIGFFLAENIENPDRLVASSEAALRTQTGEWALIFGIGLGALLGAWDGITSGSTPKALREGALGAGAGAVAGFIGGYVSQWIYHGLIHQLVQASTTADQFKGDLLLARTLGWAVLGLLVGVGLALPGHSGKKVVNGLVGGAIGGGVGGFLFQLIDNSSTGSDGFGVRLLGLTLTGIGIGLGVGLVERVRRDAWIRVTAGPMTGKELILYKAETRVGRDHRNDIVLVKDPTTEPFAASFRRDPSGAVTVLAGPGTSVLVNGRTTAQARLAPGDVVGIGRSQLTYQERAAQPLTPNLTGGRPPWPASM